MEISKPEEVNEVLLAKSQTRTLDELRKKGRDQVNVIRASDVTSMISESVNRVLRDTNLVDEADLELLVQSGTEEFKKVFQERQRERQRIEQKFRDVQDELFAAQARVRELEERLEGSFERRAQPVAEQPNAELMMRMMTEMAEMKANLSVAQGTTAAQPAAAPPVAGGAETPVDGVTQALDHIANNLNDRLEKFGRKMGISSAVEASDVKYESLFNDDSETNLESNMGDVEVKKATGGGIAGNLAKLKKLKGNG